jgi:protein-disulfide isomerase
LTSLRRVLFVFIVICLGCSAQSGSPDVNLRIERQVRSYYTIPPEVKISVGARKPSEFPNYDTVTVTFNSTEKKHDYEFLLSKDDKTLIRMTRLDLSKDTYSGIMQKIDVRERPVRGNKNAKVVVVNYDDFECPFCARMHQTLFPQLLKEYGDRVAFIYKDFPLLEMHPWAMHAAVDSGCLAAQSTDAYWDFADYLHSNQREVSSAKDRDGQFAALDHLTIDQATKHKLDIPKVQTCVKAQNEDAVKASIKEGDGLGVEATPTLYINGEKLDGYKPIGELRAALDRALQEAGEAAPAHPAAPAEVPAVPGKGSE